MKNIANLSEEDLEEFILDFPRLTCCFRLRVMSLPSNSIIAMQFMNQFLWFGVVVLGTIVACGLILVIENLHHEKYEEEIL